MRKRKSLPKLEIGIECLKRESTYESKFGEYHTVKVYDNRTHREWTEEQNKERGIVFFVSMDDVKETLNWNLNGDSSKYGFKWRGYYKFNEKKVYRGTAYIYE